MYGKIRLFFLTDVKKYKQRLAVISAIFIFLASICFSIIPFVFENEISHLKEHNSEILNNQKICYNFILQANSSQEQYYNQKDHIDILSSINKDKSLMDKKKSMLLDFRRNAALFSLSASLSVKKISQDEYNREVQKLYESNDLEIMHSVYIKYSKIAGKGTAEIDIMLTDNNKLIANKTICKNTLWYTAIVFQSIGMIIGILVIGVSKKN